MTKYQKMQEAHRNALHTLADNDCDWDWEFMHKFVLTKIRNMLEYYELGENNTNSAECNAKIIRELKHTLELNESGDLRNMYAYIGSHMREWWD